MLIQKQKINESMSIVIGLNIQHFNLIIKRFGSIFEKRKIFENTINCFFRPSNPYTQTLSTLSHVCDVIYWKSNWTYWLTQRIHDIRKRRDRRRRFIHSCVNLPVAIRARASSLDPSWLRTRSHRIDPRHSARIPCTSRRAWTWSHAWLPWRGRVFPLEVPSPCIEYLCLFCRALPNRHRIINQRYWETTFNNI